MDLITLARILSGLNDKEFFNPLTILVISKSDTGCKNIDYIVQGGSNIRLEIGLQ